MRFVVDAQLPPALARWLTGRGYQAEHVADVGMAAASDEAIWILASAMDATIITKDEDFAHRRMQSTDGPSVVWIRLRNTRKAELLAWFDRALSDIEAALRRGETVVEVV